MKEQDIKRQFLEEASDYLNTIESGLLGCSAKGKIPVSQLDAVLRAAHSIKGGAAMMGYEDLSHLAHRLEDFFKVLKSQKNPEIDAAVERLFLASVDRLREMTAFYRQGKTVIDAEWISFEINPLIQGLQEQIGDLDPEATISLVSEDAGEDMTVLLFQSEVEGCLQRIELILATPEQPCLKEEVLLVSQELGGLGEMLELPQFSQLCTAIYEQLETNPEKTDAIATEALKAWRQAQAMVIIGQKGAIKGEFGFNLSSSVATPVVSRPLSLFNLETPTTTPQDFLSTLDLSQPELLSFEESPAETATTEEKTLRVSPVLLEELADLFGEMTIGRNGIDLQLKRLRRLLSLLTQRIGRLEHSSQSLRTLYDRGIKGTSSGLANNFFLGTQSVKQRLSAFENVYFDRLEMDNYNDLHPLSQEVMETIFQIKEVTNDLDIYLGETEKTSKDFQRTSGMIQSKLNQARMRPLMDLMTHFPRALRDMSLKYGKTVDLKIQGGSTLIDRTILEALNDPLLHLFRNAFDHGIESPEIRQAYGKPPQGTIKISAYIRSQQTVIQIQDDGAGINTDKICTKALAMGLQEEDLAKASQEDLVNLIFEPGFSTAEQVSDLSGRGVGMDIVRTQVQAIQGEIKVSTQVGQGTTFTITVPTALSMIRVLLIEVDRLLIAVPCNAVEAMFLPTPDQITISGGQTFFEDEGYLIPLTHLKDRLQIPTVYVENDDEISPIIEQPTVLAIAQGNDYVGLWIDCYWGEQEVTLRPIEGNLKLPNGFTGCTILGDGRVVPLVDPAILLQQSLPLPQAFLPTGLTAKPQVTAQKDTLLVVDDSINIRRLVAVTLEKAGYRVEQAKDGQEALEKLQRGLVVQGIICDIEMPRLDGYGFLAHYKTTPMGKDVPVVMLTSRSGEKHRAIALHLGASAYFSKPFQEKELLQTLQFLITKSSETEEEENLFVSNHISVNF